MSRRSSEETRRQRGAIPSRVALSVHSSFVISASNFSRSSLLCALPRRRVVYAASAALTDGVSGELCTSTASFWSANSRAAPTLPMSVFTP
jgi:hypothetical protein